MLIKKRWQGLLTDKHNRYLRKGRARFLRLVCWHCRKNSKRNRIFGLDLDLFWLCIIYFYYYYSMPDSTILHFLSTRQFQCKLLHCTFVLFKKKKSMNRGVVFIFLMWHIWERKKLHFLVEVWASLSLLEFIVLVCLSRPWHCWTWVKRDGWIVVHVHSLEEEIEAGF